MVRTDDFPWSRFVSWGPHFFGQCMCNPVIFTVSYLFVCHVLLCVPWNMYDIYIYMFGPLSQAFGRTLSDVHW